MLFRKRAKAETDAAPVQGTHATLEGSVATRQVEQAAAEALVVQAGSGWEYPARRSVETSARTLRRVPGREALLGLLEGFGAVGLRAAGFIDGLHLEAAAPTLARLAARRLPVVLHHLGRPGGEEGAFDAVASSGLFVLHAATVQEAADLSLIAHRLAETALSPGLCVQEAASTGASLQSLYVPEEGLLAAYLGRSGDEVASPTPAQEILYGPQRRRLPALLDLDRPLGVGVTHEPYTDFLARAAGTPFFLDHLGSLADEAFARYGALTGRSYERVEGYRLQDADYVVVAEGAIIEPLLEAADHLRRTENIRAGVLKVTMRRPFPGPRVAALLRGCKGVCVVVRARPGLAGESTLLREVRAALDRAAANGRARSAAPPYPDYEAYDRPSDLPPLFEALYGDELVPPFSELCAVYLNMLPDASGRRHVFLGVPFHNPGVRLPKVERLQQRLQRGYPDLERYTLPPALVAAPDNPGAGLFGLVAEADDTTFTTGTTFARACRDALDGRIRTHTNVARLQSLRPGLFVTAHASADGLLPSPSRAWDAALVSSPFFWSETHNLNEGGLLVTHWDPDQAAALKSALAGSLTELNRKKVRIVYLDAHRMAAGLSEHPQHRPLLTLAALLGAFVATYPAFDDAQRADLGALWVRELTATMEVDKPLVEWLHQAFEQGAAQVAELPTFDLVEETSIEPEQEAPWTVRSEQQIDGTLYDLGRFWDSTGYLIESGRQDQLLADPFLATETMPARSSAIHDHAPFRDQLPQLLPEKCTACGTCWISCPDSALPVTIQDLGTLIETAFDRCKAAGHTLVQMQRVKKHLAPQAHRLFAQEEGAAYGTLGELLRGAFEGLLARMNPGEEQRQTLEAELALLLAVADGFPLVKTDTFFDAPEQAAPGSGLAFSLVVNPDACKACRTCVEVCPEGALVVRPQTPDRLATARANWRFLRGLPDASPERIAPFIREDDPNTLAYHLLSRRAYHAALGGDLTEPGSGKKTVVHLLAGLVEATLRPRIDAFIEEVAGLMTGIARQIDEKLHAAVQVDDLSALSEKLADLDAARLDVAALAPLLKQQGAAAIDREWLTRMTDAYRQLDALRKAYLSAAHGDGRARMVMGIDDGEVTRWARTFPHNPYPFPWICYASDGGAGLAEGLYAGVMQTMAGSFRVVRKARLYVDGAYKPAEHDAFFAQFGEHDFTEEERALCPPVLLLAANEVGSLDRLLGRSLPVKVLVIAEANALAEGSSGAAPAWSPALAAVAYEGVYVLQSSIGAPAHLMPALLKGLAYPGPALFYVFAPSPSRDAIPSHEVVPQARRAVAGRAVPLFTFDPGAPGTVFDRFDLSMNPAPEVDWPPQGQEAAGSETPATAPFTFADWAVREGLFRHHFAPLAAGDGQADAMPLSDYLELPEKERRGRVPVVLQPGTQAPLAVSAAMVALTVWHRDRWRLLQSLPARRPVFELPEEEQAARRRRDAALLHARLTQKLLALGGFAPAEPENTAS